MSDARLLNIVSALGAPPARTEAQIAIGTLLRRMPDLRLKVSPHSLRLRPSMVMRGLDSLPVLFRGVPWACSSEPDAGDSLNNGHEHNSTAIRENFRTV